MSKEDIAKAQEEAEQHADADKKKREAIDAKNMLSSTIYNTEKLIKDNSDKISDDDKKTLEEAVTEAKKAEESNDKETLEKALSELNEKVQPIGAKMYEAASAEASKTADSTESEDDSKDKKSKKSSKKDDEAVEGEVVEE